MAHDGSPGRSDGAREPGEPGGPGVLRPTPPHVLAVVAVVALVGGWLFHPLSDRFGTPPLVSWVQPVSLGVVALVLGYAAWATWRAVHVRGERLEPQRAVNRLALARASAYVGAVVLGGYLGYTLSWVGSPAELADQRQLRSGLAALGGLGLVVGALLLERACRVRRSPRSH